MRIVFSVSPVQLRSTVFALRRANGKTVANGSAPLCTKEALTHTPVLVEEVLNAFEGQEVKVFLDCTVGAAGHASVIAKHHPA